MNKKDKLAEISIDEIKVFVQYETYNSMMGIFIGQFYLKTGIYLDFLDNWLNDYLGKRVAQKIRRYKLGLKYSEIIRKKYR